MISNPVIEIAGNLEDTISKKQLLAFPEFFIKQDNPFFKGSYCEVDKYTLYKIKGDDTINIPAFFSLKGSVDTFIEYNEERDVDQYVIKVYEEDEVTAEDRGNYFSNHHIDFFKTLPIHSRIYLKAEIKCNAINNETRFIEKSWVIKE